MNQLSVHLERSENEKYAQRLWRVRNNKRQELMKLRKINKINEKIKKKGKKKQIPTNEHDKDK